MARHQKTATIVRQALRHRQSGSGTLRRLSSAHASNGMARQAAPVSAAAWVAAAWRQRHRGGDGEQHQRNCGGSAILRWRGEGGE